MQAAILNNATSLKNTNTDIASSIAAQFPGIKIHREDVRNILRNHNLEQTRLRTPTQQFLHLLQEDPSVLGLKVKREGDGEHGCIEAVFWSYQDCLDLWRENTEVMSLDCTYRVNRFNIPLANITGMTALHTAFPIAYCLVSGESERDFIWLLRALDNFRETHDIQLPHVLISDFDGAFRKAARSVWPDDVKHQLCVWHHVKNVVHNIRRLWSGTLEGTVVGDTGGGIGSGIARPDLATNTSEENSGDPAISNSTANGKSATKF